MIRTFELVINEAPRSMNERVHWRVVAADKTRWEEMFRLALMEQKVPRGMVHATAAAVIRWRRHARRDETNYIPGVVKPFADTLSPPTHLYHRIAKGMPRIAVANNAPRWLPDDTGDYFRFEGVTFDYNKDHLPEFVKAQTIVKLEAQYPDE